VEGGTMARKNTVVKQMDLRDCGAACLLSIIRYYGGNVPLEKLRIDTRTTKEGTTAFNLVYCAAKYGLEAAGYKMSEEQFLGVKSLPAIVHISMNGLEHFIVVYKIVGDKILVMDPAKGKETIKINDFFQIWTGNVLLFNPKGEIPNVKEQYSLIKTITNYLKYDYRLIVLIFVTNLFFMFFALASSYYFKIGLEQSSDYLKVIVICFSIILVFKCLFNYIKEYFESYLNKNLDVYLMSNFIRHLFFLPSNVIVNRTVGEIVTRVNELNNIKGIFSELFVTFFLDFFLSLITVPILYNYNKTLFFILCLSLILYFILGLISSKRIYKRVMQNIDLEDAFNSSLVENINCFQSIKNLSVTNQVLNKIEENSSHYIFDRFSFSKYLLRVENIKYFLGELSVFVINSFGFFYLTQNTITIGELIVFNSLMTFFLDPIKNLINCLPKYHFLRASFIKINEFINLDEEKELIKTDYVFTNYDLSVKNVTFSYNDYSDVLSSLNINIKENEHVMIIGPSGCGKSTFCKIVGGIEKPKEGTIMLGNVNYNELNINKLRSVVTYVSQHEHLYTDTVRNNILFYRETDNDYFEKIVKACKVDEIIATKPLKWETVVNMESDNFSGGEIQRIILARACLNKFNILIIDEALSEIDFQMEKEIINNLRALFVDKTIIYISHKNQTRQFPRVINISRSHEFV
jgi:ATP-binding cassette subfamily B protein